MTSTVPGGAAPLRDAVRGYLAHLQVERGLAANTLAAYRRDLDRYLAHLSALGVAAPAEVREEHVAAFLAAIRTGEDGGRPLVATSAARAVVAVRQFHRFLLLEGTAATDPAGEVRPPGTPQRLPKALSVGEVERLLEAAGAEGEGNGAAGPGPARAPLRQRRADQRGDRPRRRRRRPRRPRGAGLVRLRGKGGKERIVPLGSYATRALDAYLVRLRPQLAANGRGGPAVFLNARGGRLSRQSAWAVLQAAARRAGCRPGRTASRRTRCGTRSPPTCSRAAPTCASSRSCSGTPR